MKIGSVGTELFHVDRWMDGRTDGRTDMTNLIDAFPNFANVPKNCPFYIERSENLASNAMCTFWRNVGLSD
jgi:hypothetical protein